jgi:hypothetical protein
MRRPVEVIRDAGREPPLLGRGPRAGCGRIQAAKS